VNTLRGSLIYTAFATVVFLGIQWLDDIRDWQVLAISGAMFFLFTFFMLRLIQRVLALVIKPRAERGRQGRDAEERGPVVIERTTDRPDHVRRRRESRRPRGRRR
jgi:hypothetical protein